MTGCWHRALPQASAPGCCRVYGCRSAPWGTPRPDVTPTIADAGTARRRPAGRLLVLRRQSEQAVKSDRITQAKEIARRSVGQPEPCVKIDLLSGGKPIGPTGVDDLARSAVVRVIANIFDKQVRVGTDVPFHDKRRFGDRIALLTRKPELCEHATEAPTASDLP